MNLKGCGTERLLPVLAFAYVGRPTKEKKILGYHSLLSMTFFILLTHFISLLLIIGHHNLISISIAVERELAW
jgi:hypothetical protein